MPIKDSLPRRLFLSTSTKSLAAASIGTLVAGTSSAQDVDPLEGDSTIRKNVRTTPTPDLNQFYAERGTGRVSREFQEVRISRNNQELRLTIDPSTIKTIVEIGIFLYSLFGGGNERPADWISKISDQLSKIGKVLEEVQSTLEELKILIQHEFIQQAEKELLAIAEVYVRNAPSFAARPNLPAYKTSMRQLLYDIQNKVAFCRLYGYATYNTVGYAMRLETDLLYLLRETRLGKKEAFKYYRQYFDDCLNPNMGGSVSNVRATGEATLSTLESQFPSQNNAREDRGVHTWQHLRCNGDVHVYKVINGSLLGGFSGTILTTDSHKICDNSCRRCGLERSSESEDDIVRHFRDELNGQLNTWNNASRLYNDLLTRVQSLKASEEQVTKLRDVALELFNKAA